MGVFDWNDVGNEKVLRSIICALGELSSWDIGKPFDEGDMRRIGKEKGGGVPHRLRNGIRSNITRNE